jgi:hypothetical protein
MIFQEVYILKITTNSINYNVENIYWNIVQNNTSDNDNNMRLNLRWNVNLYIMKDSSSLTSRRQMSVLHSDMSEATLEILSVQTVDKCFFCIRQNV